MELSIFSPENRSKPRNRCRAGLSEADQAGVEQRGTLVSKAPEPSVTLEHVTANDSRICIFWHIKSVVV